MEAIIFFPKITFFFFSIYNSRAARILGHGMQHYRARSPLVTRKEKKCRHNSNISGDNSDISGSLT